MVEPFDHNSYYLSLLDRWSLMLDAEGLAEPEPVPEVILNIPDPHVRHHYESSWRNASRLSRLLAQWACWWNTLKWIGEADMQIPKRLEGAARGCILALCHHGWNDGNAEQLLKYLPPVPDFSLQPMQGWEGEAEEHRRVREWSNEQTAVRYDEFRGRMSTIFDKGAFRSLRKQLQDLLLLLQSDAPRPAVTNRGETGGNDKINGSDVETTGEAGSNQIPPERRTKPMAMSEAAARMGMGSHKKAGEPLRKRIESGKVKCHRLGRQSFIFDLNDFPASAHPKIRPPQ